MTSTSLTGRGKQFVLVLGFLLTVGGLFLDPVLLAIAGAMGTLLLLDLFDLVRISMRPEKIAAFEPNVLSQRLVRGESYSFSAKLSSKRKLSVKGSEFALAADPSFRKGARNVDFRIASNSVGEKSCDEMEVSILTSFQLFEATAGIPLSLNVKVYPQFLLAVAKALEYLATGRLGSGGERETTKIGRGLDYAETKEYLPGEDLRRIDWKATARIANLMVKKFFEEGGNSVHLAYIAEVPGPRSHDELATGFINILLAAVSSDTPVSVTIFRKDRGAYRITGPSGKSILAHSLEALLDYERIGYSDIYGILDLTRPGFSKVQTELAVVERWRSMLGFEGSKAHGRSAELKTILEESLNEQSTVDFALLTSLADRSPSFLEILEGLRRRMAHVTIIRPRRPWLDASSLGDAYMMMTNVERAERVAQRMGCEVVSIGAGKPYEPLVSSAPRVP
jgi:uncharacterized protein (DUF58 family)